MDLTLHFISDVAASKDQYLFGDMGGINSWPGSMGLNFVGGITRQRIEPIITQELVVWDMGNCFVSAPQGHAPAQTPRWVDRH